MRKNLHRENKSKNSIRWISAITLLAVFSPVSSADTIDFSVFAGPSYSRLHNKTSVAINEFVVNDYKTNERDRWGGLWGGSLGYSFECLLPKPYRLSFALAGYSLNFSRVNGQEFPFANDDDFDTLNYKFRAKSAALMVESRLLFYNYSNWEFFALVGIGAAWNRLSHYREVPTDPLATAAPVPHAFGNHTENAFAYEVGVGVQRTLYDDTPRKVRYAASIDYRYFNFGRGKLGGFPPQTTNDRLQIKNLDSQNIILSLIASIY